MATKREVKNTVRKINTLLKKAGLLYSELDGATQNALNDVHNNESSLGHCLRWGEQASEELMRNKSKLIDKALKDF